MFRRRTVEALMRQNAREKEQLLAVIRDQNDRLMLLAGFKYAPTPLDMAVVETDDEPDDEEFAEVGQLPDDLGFDAY